MKKISKEYIAWQNLRLPVIICIPIIKFIYLSHCIYVNLLIVFVCLGLIFLSWNTFMECLDSRIWSHWFGFWWLNFKFFVWISLGFFVPFTRFVMSGKMSTLHLGQSLLEFIPSELSEETRRLWRVISVCQVREMKRCQNDLDLTNPPRI